MLASVHEEVLVPRMAVDVDVHVDVSAFESLPHHLLHRGYLWGGFDAWVDVLYVQVESCEAAPVVADDDAVWVEHRDDFENKDIPQLLGLPLVAKQKLDYAFHDEGAVALSWVHPGADDDALAIRYLVLRRQEIGDDEHLARIARPCLAQGSPPKPVFSVGRKANPLEEHDAIGVRVRVAVGEVHLVLVVLELYAEGQRVELLCGGD